MTGIVFGVGQALISLIFSLIFYVGALLIKNGTVTVLDLYTATYAIMFSGVQAGLNTGFIGKFTSAGVAVGQYFYMIKNKN